MLTAIWMTARSIVDIEAGLQAIDRETLNPLVRKFLNSEAVEVTDWKIGPLTAEKRNVFRAAGQGRSKGEAVTWSLVLKVVGHGPDGTREARANASGRLSDLPTGIVAPRCFGVEEHKYGFWIWLEDVVDEVGQPWPLDRYSLAARHLGQFNGAYLVSRLLPTEPWLSRGWLREVVASCAALIAQLHSLLDHPRLPHAFPGSSADDLLRLWEDREVLLDALDQLPKTFGHLDAAPSNLFARRDANGAEQTVVIDWQGAGVAELGHELAPLIFFILDWARVDRTEDGELDECVFDGYLRGLRDAGWQGDPRTVRFGYAASLALRFGLRSIGRMLSFVLDEHQRSWTGPAGEMTTEELTEHSARVQRFLLDRADEARRLLAVIH